MDAYLNTAEQVLFAARRPLRPKQIIEYAYTAQLVPSHLRGSTQDKTLQARLSEDISRNRENSRFFRPSAGLFFLRQFLADPSIDDIYKNEYFAPPRRKELARDSMLALDLSSVRNAPDVAIEEVIQLLNDGRYDYRSYDAIVRSEHHAAVHSFVVVHRDSEILSYRSGKFFAKSDPIYGSRSVGIGGAVFPQDVDLLFESMVGIISNGISELCYGIGLNRRLAEKARYQNQLKPILGFRSRKSKYYAPVLHVILAYRCPDEFTPTKAALSLNDIRWVDIASRRNDVSDYDLTSQHLFDTKNLLLKICAGSSGD